MLMTDEGRKELTQVNYIAYVFSMLHTELALRNEHELFYEGEETLEAMMTNPIVLKYWPDIRHWYSSEFQEHVDRILKKTQNPTK